MNEERKLKIVIVDDEPIVRMGLRKVLQRREDAWLIVGEARNGVEAIKVVACSNPSVVITDIRMPYMDGLELAQQINESNPDISIIILTGHSDFEYARQGIRLGVSDYLLKPVEYVVLEEALLQIKTKMETEKLASVNAHLSKNTIITSGFIDNALKMIQTSNISTRKAVLFILEHFYKPMTVKEVASTVFLNPNYFSSLFKNETGFTFSDFLTRIRIEKASHFLSNTELKIYEVAEMSGFQSNRYFTQVFKEQTGMLPTEYRNRYC